MRHSSDEVGGHGDVRSTLTMLSAHSKKDEASDDEEKRTKDEQEVGVEKVGQEVREGSGPGTL